jgi:ATP-dependent Lhr-like helicase
MVFTLLKPEIWGALRKLGFDKPTEIQKVAIPEIKKGKNTLLIAPTGIGKTEAALLPIFDEIIRERPKAISTLYITPLRALNRDLMDRLEWWSNRLKIDITVRHGDTTQYMRRKQALSPPDLLITTPETLQAILPGRVMRKHLKNVRHVIIDEIHELADNKRGAQLTLAIERLQELCNRKFQRIGISATIGSPEIIAKFLSKNEPVEVLKVSPIKLMDLKVEKPKPKKGDKEIAAKIFSSLEASSRLRRIRECIEEHRSTLIFVNTREMAEILASRFRVIDAPVGIHHSSLSQEARISAERQFKKEELKALICTSSLELGIDIGSIDLVIQYKSPRQVARLLQRVGRSGHGLGMKSKGIVIVTDPDDIMEALVISRRAYRGQLEEVETHEKPYDVLAHQLVGLALEYGRVKKSRAYEIVRGSWLYSDLTWEELEETLNLLNSLKLVWLEEDAYGKTRFSWEYYYGNLSTIPDEKKYFVRNIVTREGVGALDEAFVVNYVEPGNVIIFKGAPWRIVSVDDEILVEPAEDITGAIPSWTGEEIPVPYEVALEVGELRGNIKNLEKYPSDGYTKRLAASKINRHIRECLPVPSAERIIIELFENFVVMHFPFGTKVNQTIGRVFSIMLTSKFGSSVALQVDPYRIILQSPKKLYEEDILELLKIDPGFIRPLLDKTLKRTSVFKWRFVNVAKRFGALSKDVSYHNVKVDRIIDAYEDSLIFKEVLKEVYKDDLDLRRAEKVLGDISSGTLSVEIVKLDKPSPIAELGLRAYSEIIVPKRAEQMILKALKNRIMEKRVEVFCLYCANWSSSFKVKNIPEDLKCENCGARMLAVLKGRNRELKSLYRSYKSGKSTSKDDKKEITAMQTSANLFLSYGKKAIIAQAARGIGPTVAKRVLLARDEEELYKNILKAERNYAKTKKFWD